MHFNDLELCTYSAGPYDHRNWECPLKSVGWLEHSHPFQVGRCTDAFERRLVELVEQTRRSFRQYVFRGFYSCAFCEADGVTTGGAGWSQEILLVPGVDCVYASPGAIAHYAPSHGYQPPPEFMDAVLDCADCGSERYLEALRESNFGHEVPIETWEAWLART